MKNIKTIVVALLCVLLCATLFTACQEPTATATPTPSGSTNTIADEVPEPEEVAMKAGDKYRIFVWNNVEENQQVDGTQGTRGADIRQRWLDFKEKYGVEITWIANPNTSDWISAAFDPAAAGEPIADIVHMGGPFVIPTALGYGGTALGSLYEDLGEYSQYTNFDNGSFWDQTAKEAMGVYNGKQYITFACDEGWGAAAVNQVTFFNKKLIQEGGYTADEIYNWYQNGEWTFDKYREVALACTDTDKGVYGAAVAQNGMAMLSLITANNGSVLTPNAQGVPEFSADSTNAMYAINFFLDMCKNDGSVCLENGISQTEATLFKTGKVATMLTYANRVQEGEGPRGGALYQQEGIEYGIVLPPKGPNATDYMSDKNWATPYAVFKGHDNPAGAVQCLSYYLCPQTPIDGLKQQMLLEADAAAYFQDEQSVQTLKDAVTHNVTTSYMAYWSVTSDGVGLCTVTSWGFDKWVSGESTPEIDFAAGKDAVNNIIANTIASQQA